MALEWGEARHLELFADVEIPAPDVPDWLLPVWRCWHRLNLDRPWHSAGMGGLFPGRIPWRTLREWAEFHGMSGDDFLFLDRCVREMDSVYLEIMAAKRKQ